MLNAIATKLGGHVAGTWALAYPDWAFYKFAAISTPEGVYISTDSGCSCPTPWESHSTDSFTGPLTVEQAVEEYTSLVNVGGYESLTVAQRDANIEAIREALA